MARRFTRPLCTISSVHQIKRSRAPQKPQGREARRSCTLDGEDRTVQSRVQGKGGHGPRCGGGAAFDPGFGFFNFVSTGLGALTTCCLITCLITYGMVYPNGRRIETGSVPEWSWKTPQNHSDLWKIPDRTGRRKLVAAFSAGQEPSPRLAARLGPSEAGPCNGNGETSGLAGLDLTER